MSALHSPPAASPTPPTPPDAPGRRALRRWLRWLVIVLCLLALAGGGWWAWKNWGAAAPGSERLLAKVQRGDIEDLVGATGSLQPRNYVDVGAQVSGQLKKILVEVGDPVIAGQLLAEIDAEQAAARVEANRASLRAQQASLTERQANLAQAQRDLQRQRNLAAEAATTTEQVEIAETSVRTSQAQITALQAQIAQAQATMRIEEANLKFTRIFAPMAGTVVSITARQGQTLNTNQSAPTLLRIADLSTMTVQTQVSEADVSKLRLGMPSYFTTLGSQGRRWQGRLRKIEPTPTVTNNVVLYNALFDVPNPTGSLMSNMTAQVFFVVAEARDVLLVPMSALTLDAPAAAARRAPAASAPVATSPASAGRIANAADAASAGAGPRTPRGAGPRRATVQVQATDGTLQTREVQVGVSNRINAQVLSGLQEGEQVVTGIRQPAASRRAPATASTGLGAAAGAGGTPPGGPGGR